MDLEKIFKQLILLDLALFVLIFLSVFFEPEEVTNLYNQLPEGFFYTNLDPNLTNEEKRTAVRSKASTFSNPLKSYLEVKKLSKKLYNFSTWLTANRETLTKSEVDERMNEVTSVSNAKRILIWDN